MKQPEIFVPSEKEIKKTLTKICDLLQAAKAPNQISDLASDVELGADKPLKLIEDQGENIEAIKTLLSDINPRFASLVLYRAFARKREDVVSLLLDLDVDPAFLPSNGENALFHAARNNWVAILERLLTVYDLNPDVFNRSGESLIDVALASKSHEAVSLLSLFGGYSGRELPELNGQNIKHSHHILYCTNINLKPAKDNQAERDIYAHAFTTFEHMSVLRNRLSLLANDDLKNFDGEEKKDIYCSLLSRMAYDWQGLIKFCNKNQTTKDLLLDLYRVLSTIYNRNELDSHNDIQSLISNSKSSTEYAGLAAVLYSLPLSRLTIDAIHLSKLYPNSKLTSETYTLHGLTSLKKACLAYVNRYGTTDLKQRAAIRDRTMIQDSDHVNLLLRQRDIQRIIPTLNDLSKQLHAFARNLRETPDKNTFYLKLIVITALVSLPCLLLAGVATFSLMAGITNSDVDDFFERNPAIGMGTIAAFFLITFGLGFSAIKVCYGLTPKNNNTDCCKHAFATGPTMAYSNKSKLDMRAEHKQSMQILLPKIDYLLQKLEVDSQPFLLIRSLYQKLADRSGTVRDTIEQLKALGKATSKIATNLYKGKDSQLNLELPRNIGFFSPNEAKLALFPSFARENENSADMYIAVDSFKQKTK